MFWRHVEGIYPCKNDRWAIRNWIQQHMQKHAKSNLKCQISSLGTNCGAAFPLCAQRTWVQDHPTQRSPCPLWWASTAVAGTTRTTITTAQAMHQQWQQVFANQSTGIPDSFKNLWAADWGALGFAIVPHNHHFVRPLFELFAPPWDCLECKGQQLTVETFLMDIIGTARI